MNDPQPDPNGWNSPIVDLWVDFTMLFCSLFCWKQKAAAHWQLWTGQTGERRFSPL